MSRVSILMLSDTSGQISATGEPVRADGYFGFQDGLHTISIHVQRYLGNVWIEGSLASDPQENDWFPIHLGGRYPYIRFPRDPNNPSSTSEFSGANGGDTGVFSFNFTGNFVWLRARTDREAFNIHEDDFRTLQEFGAVTKILLNH